MIMTCCFLLCGCLTSDTPNDNGIPVQHQSISDCGGFETEIIRIEGADYCEAEVLSWQFEGEVLQFVDSRVPLNCCGDRAVEVEIVGNIYIITETDRPENGEARCRCSCVFDFSLTIEDVPEGVIDVELYREITDEGVGPELLWQGEIDLTETAGSVTIDDSMVSDCSSE